MEHFNLIEPFLRIPEDLSELLTILEPFTIDLDGPMKITIIMTHITFRAFVAFRQQPECQVRFLLPVIVMHRYTPAPVMQSAPKFRGSGVQLQTGNLGPEIEHFTAIARQVSVVLMEIAY